MSRAPLDVLRPEKWHTKEGSTGIIENYKLWDNPNMFIIPHYKPALISVDDPKIGSSGMPGAQEDSGSGHSRRRAARRDHRWNLGCPYCNQGFEPFQY